MLCTFDPDTRMMETFPPEFWQAIDQFNLRQFYACHDTLEALWMEAMEPEKRFYQGILQIAVALYHLENENWRGAVILMGDGMNRLRDYQPAYGNINIKEFLSQTSHLLKILQQVGPEQVSTVIQQLREGEGKVELNAYPPLSFPILQKLP
ncbi:MAG: DUF309 domain-containing protein [Kovacikia sp.]